MKIIKSQRGLTLIELLAVVVILGIIAAIAVPSIGKVIDNARKDAHIANATQVIYAAKLAMASGVEPGTPEKWPYNKKDMYTVDKLVKEGFLSEKLKNPRFIPGFGYDDYNLAESIIVIDDMNTNPVYKANLHMGGGNPAPFKGNYIFPEPLPVEQMKRSDVLPK